MSLKHWYKTKLIAAETHCLNSIAPTLCGYYLLLLGNQKPLSWIPKNRLYSFSLSPENSSSARSHYESLPLRENNIDAVFLPYTLESCEDPLECLKECHRSLVAEGKIFVFTYQPWHPLNWLNHSVKNPLSLLHAKNFLQLAGFTINKTKFIHYGAVTMIEAQKHVSAVTPLKPAWGEKKLILEKQWQPTTREANP